MRLAAIATGHDERCCDSLAALLPYIDCGEVDGFGPLHLLADDTLGHVLQFDLPVTDTVPDGEAQIASAIATLLQALPAGVQWQWFVQVRAQVEDALALYLTQAGRDPLGRRFAAQYVQRWRQAQHEGFFPDAAEHGLHPRAQRVLLALKSAPIGFGPGHVLAASLCRRRRVAASKAHGRAVGAEQRAARFAAAVRDLARAVSALGFAATALDAQSLAEWVTDLLFPYRGLERAALPLHEHSVRETIAAAGRLEAICARGFRSVAAGTEAHHRVVSLLWQPRGVEAGMLNGLPGLRPWLSVCLTGSTLAPTAALLQLKAQSLLNLRSTHRFNETESNARQEAIGEVEHRLFSEGERLIDGRLQIHVVERTEEDVEQAAVDVCKFLQTLDVEAAVEQDIGSALLLQGCLPLAVYPVTEAKLRRRRRFLSRDFADIHPAGGCWTGLRPDPASSQAASPTQVVMYANALGEPLFIDPSKAEKNPHALVIGQSGSGKSFFVHDYLLHLWRLPDVRLYLISIKPDYRKLALLLGRYVELALDSAVSISPFGGAPSLENQARWFTALALMITEGHPDRKLAREEEVALQDAAMAAARRNWDGEKRSAVRETLLEDIATELERSHGAAGRHLAFQLLPYRRGPYRRLFNAPRSLTAADRFVFFNLGRILGEPCSPVVSFCIFGLIDEVIADPRLRSVPKGLVADEVWALARDPHAAAILDRALKAYRSLGAFAMPIVQDLRDLDTPGGRVMLVNTATKIILPLDRAGQDDLPRFVRLNPRELELVRNLRLVKRRYSEFFISIDGTHSAKGLLIPEPLRYAVSTTDPADEDRIERHFQDCGDMLTALERFAQQTPYGLRAAAAT